MTATGVLGETATAARVADEIRGALSRNAPLRISGAGTWMDAGAPVEASTELSLVGDSGVVEYVPGDLTMTVMAGTPLSSIRDVAAANRQWLPLDPYGSSRGTIGATIATASYGPLALAFGTPRDQLLGVEFVTGRGEVVRGGGRVTKNVAGFDLSRLVCGSWGTIGVITEVTMRLRALPDADVSVATPLPGSSDELAELLTRLRDAGVSPAAHELLNPARCRETGIDAEGAMLLRFCGNEAGVRVQVQRVSSLTENVALESSIWDTLRSESVGNDIVLRVSGRRSELPSLLQFADAEMNDVAGLRIQASVGRGIARMRMPASALTALSNALQKLPSGRFIFEKLPADAWRSIAPDIPNSDLNKRVRDAFDPHRILNPGIHGGDF